MRAELHLARRYLIGLRRRTHVVTVTLISLVGLGLGVLALVVTLALLEGFQSTIRDELVRSAAHARIRPTAGRSLRDPDTLVSVLQGKLPDVEMVQVVRGTCLVSSRIDAVPALVIGRSDTHRVAVDQVAAARLGVGMGDQLHVISPRQRLTPMGPVPVRVAIEVGSVRDPEPGVDTGAVWLPLGDAQRVLWGRPVVDSIELRRMDDPWRLGHDLRAVLAGDDGALKVESLYEIHRPLLLALTLERVVIFAAVGLILVVASLNLLCNVAMVAAEKRKDLAVLSGLGLTPASIRRLFLLLGLGIGMVGALAGATCGIVLSLLLDRTRALPLPNDVFVVSAVPFRVDPLTIGAVVGVALLLSAAASWLPSRLVARREPAEGLRYE